ncbi:MAG: M28 family peptidase [Candidatus Pedobacter colombiensis]|uniref:M28 family peptidase n=1 Tax=Candidatus Pedobacter colombiensis TaxID=3121371 RepID=A0AAJ5W905_9SPHI|nr:M28 family peptidase [Pedobacter sp.]WEK19229.1 MAG: M28 family peptidase [Pedobacter sp.]
MKKCLIILCLIIPRVVLSQDIKLTRAILDTLTSKTMWGRGYTHNGLGKAADYISAQFKTYGLSPMGGKTFKQDFSFSVNTFPGNMELKINGKSLVAGKEFIVMPESMGSVASGKLEQKDSTVFISSTDRLVLVLKDKLTWSVSNKVADYTGIEVLKKATTIPETFDINIENRFIPEFKTANICGLVRGTMRPDSLIVLTAHYDHLGGMGNTTYFPGANDNASGVSFLMSMAKHYAANPAPYTMAFICFSAEEPGLIGSQYFTEHPLIELNKIRFLVNLDMVGTGETGITVVNATEYPKEFALLNQVNDAHHYLAKINSRGKAANSDHYFFSEKGVPAFFIYTTGGISAYHDVFDRPDSLPFTKYNDLFKLFVDFNNKLMQ